MTKEQIIFLHIPKTAGTTLRNFICAQYAAEKILPIYPDKRFMDLESFRQLSAEKKDTADLFIGHFSYGFHNNLSGNRPYKYATILREPLARSLSLYNHMRHRHFAGIDITLSEILASKQGRQFQNSQVRHIAGRGNKNILERAIKNIEQDFSFIGITERFNESLLLASHQLGWRLRPYKSQNITSMMWEKNFADELFNDVDSMQVLRNLNAEDMELYKLADLLFKQQLAHNFPDAAPQIQRFESLLQTTD